MSTPLFLVSTEVVNVEDTPSVSDLVIVPLPIVSVSMPAPTLVDGRPT